jgi:carbamoyltransferase
VKYREIFRPFCPSVLEEDAQEWFKMDKLDYPAYYMLMAHKVKPNKMKYIPAVTHVDETARLQLVSKKVDKRYHNLLREFKKITGIPLVLNTSFNIQEPIVCSPQDAINTFLKSKMDFLVMGNFITGRNNKKRS